MLSSYQQELLEKQLLHDSRLYREHPDWFTQEQVEALQQRAQNLGVDIEQDPDGADFNLFNTVGQALSGFASGLTTIHTGDDPRNTAEAISRNIGHLLGFVGFIPGLGLLGRTAMGGASLATKAAKSAKTLSLAEATLGKTKIPGAIKDVLKVRPSKWGVKIPSVPMIAADVATKGVGKLLGNVEALKAVKFLREGTAGRAIVGGGFHLAAASAVSNWQQGTDAMMEGFIGGAQMGAVFGGIGNYVKLGKLLKDTDPQVVVTAEKVVRGMAGAAFTGLPSTMRGDATELQVYEYLLGAWFGAHAVPAEKVHAAKIMNDPENPNFMSREDWQDPTKMTGWSDLPEGTRQEILKASENRADMTEAFLQEFESLGIVPQGAIVDVIGGIHSGKKAEIIKKTQKGYKVIVDVEGKKKESFIKQKFIPDAPEFNPNAILVDLPEGIKEMEGTQVQRIRETAVGWVVRYDNMETGWHPYEHLKAIGEEGVVATAEGDIRDIKTGELIEPPPSPKKPSVKNQEIIDEIARLNAETLELDIGYSDIRQINWNSDHPTVKNNPKAQKLAQEFADLNQKIQTMSPAELAELPEPIRNEFIDYPASWGYSRAQRGINVHSIKKMLEMYEYTLRTEGKESAEEYYNTREIKEKTPKEVVAKWRKGVEEINRVVEKEEAAAATPAEVKPAGVTKIISGGQIGADQIGLEVGKEIGLETGGTAPPGFQTSKGKKPKLLKEYGLVEGEADPKVYRKRTIQNIKDSDGTVLFGKETSPGSKLTKNQSLEIGKPYIANPTVEELSSWLKENNIKTLNVAGNRAIANDPDAIANMKSVLRDAISISAEAPAPISILHRDAPSMPMHFKDGTGGRKMRPEFSGKSTMDLILSGDRTATTRNLSDVKNLKVGDILDFYDKNSKKAVTVRVTKAPYKVSDITPKEWSKLEGWDKSGYQQNKNRWQFQFELINKPDKAKPELASSEQVTSPEDRPAETSLQTKNREIKDTVEDHDTNSYIFDNSLETTISTIQKANPTSSRKSIQLWMDKRTQDITQNIDFFKFMDDLKSSWEVSFEEGSQEWNGIRRYFNRRRTSLRETQSYFTLLDTKDRGDMSQKAHIIVRDRPQSFLEMLPLAEGVKKSIRKVVEYAEWVDTVGRNRNGTPKRRYSVEKLFDMEFDGFDFIVNRKEATERGGFTTVEKRYPLANIFLSEHKSGYTYLSGVKDKNRMIFIPHQIEPENAVAWARAFIEEISDPNVVNNARSQYNKGLAKFRIMINHGREKGKKIENRESEEIYAQSVYSTAAVIERMNGGMPLKDIIKYNTSGEGQFITDPITLNQRMQIIDSGEPTMDPLMYQHIPDMKDGFRLAIVNAIPGKLGKMSWNREILKDMLNKSYDAHLDGVFLVRDDVFNAMAKDAGIPKDGAVLKGFMRYTDQSPSPEIQVPASTLKTLFGKRRGLILGKYAYFSAGKEASTELQSKNMHGYIFDTATKQLGRRSKYDINLNEKGELDFYTENTKVIDPNPEIYTIPHSGLTISPGNYEHVRRATSNVQIVKQLLGNANNSQIDKKVVAEAVEKVLLPAVAGDPEVNAKWDKYIKTGEEKHIKEFLEAEGEILEERFEKVSLDRIIDLVDGVTVSDSPLYRKFWKMLLHAQGKPITNRTEELDNNTFEESELDTDIIRRADIMLGEAGALSAPIINFKLVRFTTDRILAKYATRRIVKPVVGHSGTAIGVPYDPWLQKDINLRPGEFYLNNKWKNFVTNYTIVKADGIRANLTLDQLLSRRTELKNKLRRVPTKDRKAIKTDIESVNEALELAIIRVPSDSISGTRILKFMGFTGRKGAGILLHPEDMGYLGGMDLDIDKVHIYQNLPKSLKESIKKQSKEWHKGKKFLKPVTRELEEIFSEEGNLDLDMAKTPFGMLDPLTRFYISHNARKGNKLLGLANNLKRRIHMLQDITEGKEKRIPFTIPRGQWKRSKNIRAAAKKNISVEYPKGELYIVLKPNKDGGKKLRLYARAIQNMAADAAKYTGIINPEKLTEILFKAAFDKIEIVTPDGKRVANVLENEKSVGLIRGTIYRGMEELNKAVSGWDYTKKRSLTLSEKSDLANSYLGYGQAEGAIESKGIKRDLLSPLDEYRATAIRNVRHDPDPSKWLSEKEIVKAGKVLEEIVHGTSEEAIYFREKVLSKLQFKVATARGEDPIEYLKNIKDLDKKRDYYSKTLAALTSVRRVFKANKAFLDSGGTTEELTEIFKTADKLLTQYAQRMLDINKKKRERTVERKAPVINEINALIRSYVETIGEATGKRAFFEYFIGTMSGSTYSDNLRSFGFESPVVPRPIIEGWLNDYHKLATKLGEPITSEEVAVFMGKKPSKDPKVQRIMKEVEKEVTGDKAEASADEMSKKMWEGIEDYSWVDVKTRDKRIVNETREVKRLRKELRWIFQKHPTLLHNISKSFPGITSLRGTFGIPIPGAGVLPGAATIEDVKVFINYWRGLHGRNFLLDMAKDDPGYALKWFHFYFFPDTISQKHLAYNLNWFARKNVPVRAADGKVYKKDVAIPIAHYGRMVDMGIKSNLWFSNTTDRWAKRVNDEFEFLFLLEKDAPDLVNIAIAYRERALASKHNEPQYEKYAKEADELYEIYKDKIYNFPSEGKKKGRVTKTGKEIIEIINRKITKLNTNMKDQWIKGEYDYDEWVAPYRDKSGNIKFSEIIKREISDVLFQGKEADLKKVGLENLLRLSNEYAVSRMTINGVRIKDMHPDKRANIMSRYLDETIHPRTNKPKGKFAFKGVGEIEVEHYWPHRDHIKKIKDQYIEARIEKAKAEGKSATALAKLRVSLETTAMRAQLDDGGALHPMAEFIMTEGMTEKDVERIGLFRRPSHALSRARHGHVIPSWAKDMDAYRTYINQIIKANYNLMFTLSGHRIMEDFSETAKTTFKPDQVKQWARFGRLHLRDILGYKSSMPENWIADRNFPVKNTLYYLLSDQHVKKKMDKIATKWFGGKGWVRKNEDGTLNEDDLSYKLNLFSNLEAKWELMTLLTHTKTMANNFWGGSLNTLISTGFRHWKSAGSLDFLNSNIPMKKGDPESRDWDYYTAFTQRHGAIESFLRSELKANPALRSKRGANFINDLIARVNKDGTEISRASVFEIGNKHGFTKAWIEKSAWFMKFMEQKLRRRAFLAHYINAMEVLSANKVAFERDDPWLIEMAMKGVEGTQYLYNNAARPAFSRTSLGRVYSRFQLWAWNSLKFRKDIYKGAKLYDYQPGTPEFDRFKRMGLADLFMFSMATAFPLTMFESTLPPPWNYVQDMSDLLFGNEHERDRAFFGTLPKPIAPLQAVSPPIARHILGPLGALLKNDWGRFADYHVWTWFPFGRIARDIKGTLEYPSMLVEKATGVPIHRISKELIKRREEPALAPTGIIQYHRGSEEDILSEESLGEAK